MSAALITIRRDETNYGPYTLAEIHSMLSAGQVDHRDLAWLEGTADWTDLGSIPGVAPPAPASTDSQGNEGHGHDDHGAEEPISDRLVLPAFLLAFFLGMFGAHRFYVGKKGSAIAMLVMTLTIVGAFVTFFWALVDWIMIVSGVFPDEDDKLLKRWA